MRALFDLIDAAPQDVVFGVVGLFLVALAISDRLLARRWSS